MKTNKRSIFFLIKFVVFISTFILLNSCLPTKSTVLVNLKKNSLTEPLNVTVSNIKFINNQIIVTGTNLNTVSNFKIKEGATQRVLQIESQTSTSLVANTISNVTFAVGKVFDFILSNAHATSTFTVDFSLCDTTLGGKNIACLVAPSDKQVLSYDLNSQTWRPRSVNGLSYKGVWGSLPTLPAVGALVPGDYFIVSVANGSYTVGDWMVLNDDGVTFEKIDNSIEVKSVFGRNADVVAQESDYHLDLLGDVDLSSGAMLGDALIFNGTQWVAGAVSGGGGAPTGAAGGDLTGTYPNPTIGTNKITDTHIANGAISQTKINGLATSLSGKEATITATTAADYFRGDKTFATLNTSVVPEGSNLYFTNARALGILLTGFDNSLTGQVSAGDSMLQGFGRLQNQINSLGSTGSNYLVKNGSDTISGTVSVTNVITATGAGDIVVNSVPLTMTSAVNKTYADGKLDKTTGGTVAGVVTLDNDLKIKSGSNYVTIKGNAATAADYTFVLPTSAGTAGHFLSTDGSGNTSWVSAGGGGAPTGAATGDLGGSYPAPSVATVGGVTAANVAAGANLANAATNSNTANTIVKRDGSGNFTATNVSGTVDIANGGTGATTAAAARTNLGLGTAAIADTGSLINQLPLLGANATVGSMCTFDLTLGFICNTAIPTGNAITTNPLSQFAATTSAQLAGVLSDETGSGLAVFNTAPTFLTNLTAPLIIGGTGTTSTLTYKTTSGVGAVGADHIFQVGNNGATEAMRILNNGNVGIGTAAPGALLHVNGTVRAMNLCDETGANCQDLSTGIVPVLSGISRGTQASPTIRFGGDTNTGIFSPGPDQVGISVAGDLYARFNNQVIGLNKRVSVSNLNNTAVAPELGTSNSATVVNSGTVVGEHTFDYGGRITPGRANISLEATETFSTAAQGGSMNFITIANGTTTPLKRMTINHNGNVGIGTTTPASMLDVNGAVKVGVDATACSGTIAGAMRFNTPNVEYCNGTSWAAFSAGSNGDFKSDGSVAMTGSIRAVAGILGTPGISFGDLDTGFWGSGSEVFFQTNGANNFKLTSSGMQAANIDGFNIDNGGSGTPATPTYGWRGAAGAGTGFFNPASQVIALSTNSLERLRIDASGNVGIGSTSPGAKLEVAGQVKITGGTPGAGKVLTSDAAGLATWQTPAGGGVTTVFTRSGAVVATAGDYTASQVTNVAAGDIAAVTTQAAINELDSEKQSIASFAADVRAVVLTGLSTATNAVIAGTDSILVAFGKLQAQISGQTTSKADLTNVAQSITASNITTTTINGVPFVNGAWTTSGSDVYRSSGKVGIGTSSPLYELSVATASGNLPATSGSSADGGFRLFNGNHALDMGIVLGGLGAWIQTRSTTNYSTKFGLYLNPRGGGVSIGETSAGQSISSYNTANGLLSVNGVNTANSNSYGILALTNNAPASSGKTLGEIRFTNATEDSDNRDAAIISAFASGTGGADSYGGALSFQTKPDNVTGVVERMRLTPAGNLGIGTITPGAKLEVAGQVKITGGTPGAGKVLTSDAAGLATWETLAAGTPAGSTNQIQYNSGGVFAAETEFFYNATGNFLQLSDATTPPEIRVSKGTFTDQVVQGTGFVQLESTNTANPYTPTGTRAAPLLAGEGGGIHLFKRGMSDSAGSFVTLSAQNTASWLQSAYVGVVPMTGSSVFTPNLVFGGQTGASSYQEHMRITGAGNLGIGTTTPGAKLEVAGQVKITGGTPGTGKILTSDAAGLASWASSLAANRGGTGQTSFAIGDLLYASSASALSKLSAGTAGKVLKSNGPGSAPSWENDSFSVGSWIEGPVNNLSYPYPISGMPTLGIRNSYGATDWTSIIFDSFDGYNVAAIGYGNGSAPAYPNSLFLEVASGKSIMFGVEGSTKMIINTAGSVGIGTSSPSYTLHVNGSVAGTSAYNNLSDERFKKNIATIPDALEKILKLEGVFYDFKTKEFPERNFSNHREMGVIAQKVEKVFPEVITKDKDGYRSVAYSMLIAPIIEAIKTLNERISDLFEITKGQSRAIASKADKVVVDEMVRKLETENSKLKQESALVKKENSEIKAYLCSKDKNAAFCK